MYTRHIVCMVLVSCLSQRAHHCTYTLHHPYRCGPEVESFSVERCGLSYIKPCMNFSLSLLFFCGGASLEKCSCGGWVCISSSINTIYTDS